MVASKDIERIAIKIYMNPAYTDIVRAKGWSQDLITDDKVFELTQRHGAENISKAQADIMDENKQLRPQLIPHCRMLLGPRPEEEDEFWRHPDGTPMQRRSHTTKPASRKKLGNEAALSPKGEPSYDAADVPAVLPEEKTDPVGDPVEAAVAKTAVGLPKGYTCEADTIKVTGCTTVGQAIKKHPDHVVLCRLNDQWHIYKQKALVIADLLGLPCSPSLMTALPKDREEQSIKAILAEGYMVALYEPEKKR